MKWSIGAKSLKPEKCFELKKNNHMISQFRKSNWRRDPGATHLQAKTNFDAGQKSNAVHTV